MLDTISDKLTRAHVWIPDLPYELERDIFELTARAHKGSAATLVLVARRVQIWIEPLMYEMVTLRSTAEVTSFMQALEYKPARFLAARVKTLCLTNSVTKEQAARILSVCSGVVNLACWVVRKPHETLNLSTFIAPLHLKRLSIDAQTYMDLQDLSQNDSTTATSSETQNWRSDLTHLDIIDWWPTLELSNLPGLDLFHNLTHFSLYFGYTYNSGTPLSSILKICNYLSVLLVTVDEKDDATAAKGYLKEAGFDDPRLAVLPFPNAITDWEAPLKGGDDIWLQAEAVVQKQCHDSSDSDRS